METSWRTPAKRWHMSTPRFSLYVSVFGLRRALRIKEEESSQPLIGLITQLAQVLRFRSTLSVSILGRLRPASQKDYG